MFLLNSLYVWGLHEQHHATDDNFNGDESESDDHLKEAI